MAEDGESGDTIIIKKIKKGGGHHGGAWKVAYADFVTAMMAFFLLLWLLNVTTEEQKNAISNYFDPTHPKVSQSESGAGGVLGGLTVAPQGSMASTVQPVTPQQPSHELPSLRGQPTKEKQESEEDIQRKKKAKEEEERFEKAAEELKKKIMEVPELAALAENLIIDMTPEGLRIQIVDSKGKSMFASGSAEMYQETQLLVGTVTQVIMDLPNDISIRGHTDGAQYGEGATYTNWELSADRANSTRRVMKQFGLPVERLGNVVGKADTEHLNTEDPYDPRNRRISIILLKEDLTKEPEPNEATVEETTEEEIAPPEAPSLPAPMRPPPVGTFRKTPGEVEFP